MQWLLPLTALSVQLTSLAYRLGVFQMIVAYRWQLLGFVLLMQGMVMGVTVFCFGFFVVHWMEEFSAERGLFMLAYTGMMIVNAILSPVAGMWIDRYSQTMLVLLGLTGFIGGLLLVSVAPVPILILAVYALLYPFSNSLAGPLISQALVVRAFEKNRGTALGICALGATIGGIVMPVVVTDMLETIDWRYLSLLLAGISGLILLPLAFLILRQAPKRGASLKKGPEKRAYRELLKNADVYKIAIATFVPSVFYVAVLLNIGLYAVDLGISQQQASLIVSMAAGLTVVGKLLAGWLADNISHNITYYALCVIIFCSMYLTATANEFLPLASGVAVLGTAVGGVVAFVERGGGAALWVRELWRLNGAGDGRVEFNGPCSFDGRLGKGFHWQL